MAADCLLALRGRPEDVSDAEEARMGAGAILLAELIQDVKLIRKSLSQS